MKTIFFYILINLLINIFLYYGLIFYVSDILNKTTKFRGNGKKYDKSSYSKIDTEYNDDFGRLDDFEYKINKELNILLNNYLLNCNEYNISFCKEVRNKIKKIHPEQHPDEILYPFPVKYNISMDSNTICKEGMSLIIGVVSSPNSFKERNVYRKLYNKFDYIQLYFFMGTSKNPLVTEMVSLERNKYNDIIMFDFTASYYNLTVQYIATIRWINERCKNYKYFVYHQIDVYLNLPLYEKFIKNERTYQIIGITFTHVTPERNPISRWYMPMEIYPKEYYPDYPLGCLVFFSEYSVNRIIPETYKEKRTIYIDDVYIGFLIDRLKLFQYSVDLPPQSNLDMSIKDLENWLIIHGLEYDLIYYLAKLTYK